MLKTFYNGKVHTCPTIRGLLSSPTREGLDALIEGVRTEVTKRLGRPATDDIVANGLPRPEPTKSGIEARRQAAREQYEARMAAAQTPAEFIRLEAARVRANEERRSKLSRAELELEDAQAAAKEVEERLADEARREAIRQTPAYVSTLKQARDLLFAAALDESISADQLAAFQNQLTSLEETQDVATVRSNLRTIQKAITDQLTVEADKLRQATDAIAKRKSLLGEGMVFDDVGVELVGETEYVSLTVGTEVRRVTKATYEGRTSDEALKVQLFGGEVANV